MTDSFGSLVRYRVAALLSGLWNDLNQSKIGRGIIDIYCEIGRGSFVRSDTSLQVLDHSMLWNPWAAFGREFSTGTQLARDGHTSIETLVVSFLPY